MDTSNQDGPGRAPLKEKEFPAKVRHREPDGKPASICRRSWGSGRVEAVMRMIRPVLAMLPVLAAGVLTLPAPARAVDDKSLDALAGPASSRFT